VSLRAQVALMAEQPESTVLQDLEIQAKLKVELQARQHEVSATKILCWVANHDQLLAFYRENPYEIAELP
jgi:hypothetical protein